MDANKYGKLAKDFKPDLLMHLPCMLSGTSEKNVLKSFKINMDSFVTAVDIAKENKSRLFCPSSIASFG